MVSSFIAKIKKFLVPPPAGKFKLTVSWDMNSDRFFTNGVYINDKHNSKFLKKSLKLAIWWKQCGLLSRGICSQQGSVRLLGYNATWTCRQVSTIWRIILPASSVLQVHMDFHPRRPTLTSSSLGEP